jgi:hypothetical protein
VLTLENSNTAGVDNTWIFNIGGAFTTMAGSVIKFTDYDPTVETRIVTWDDRNVAWLVDGAITLGAASYAIGNMTSTEGAITVASAATCDNLKAAGAITVGAGATTLTGDVTAGGAITVGALAVTGDLVAGGACTGSDKCPL